MNCVHLKLYLEGWLVEGGQSKVGRNSIYTSVFVLFHVHIGRNLCHCWIPPQKLSLLGFFGFISTAELIYFALKSVVFLLVGLPFRFTSLIFLCDILACCTSFVLFCPPLAPGRSRSGGPCCVLCLNFSLLIGSEMDVWPKGDSFSDQPLRYWALPLEDVK